MSRTLSILPSVILIFSTSSFAYEQLPRVAEIVTEAYEPSNEDRSDGEELIRFPPIEGAMRPLMKSVDLVGDGVVRYRLHGGHGFAVELPKVELNLLAKLTDAESTRLVYSALAHLEENASPNFGIFKNTSLYFDDLKETTLYFDQYVEGMLVHDRQVVVVLGEDRSLRAIKATPVLEDDLLEAEQIVSAADASALFEQQYGRESNIASVKRVIVGQPPVIGSTYASENGEEAVTVSDDGEWLTFKNQDVYHNGPMGIIWVYHDV